MKGPAERFPRVDGVAGEWADRWGPRVPVPSRVRGELRAAYRVLFETDDDDADAELGPGFHLAQKSADGTFE